MLSCWVGTLIQTKIGTGWITFFTKGSMRAKYINAYGKTALFLSLLMTISVGFASYLFITIMLLSM